MKTSSLIPTFALAISVVAPVSLSAQITKAPTAAEISAKRRQANAVYEKAAAQAVEEMVSIERAKPSLLGDSDFLVGAYGFVLIPKGAVIAEGKMISVSHTAPAKGKMMQWNDFYRKHRSGLRLISINDKQWMGEVSLEPLRAKVEAAHKSNFTTLTSLNGDLVSLPEIHQLSPSKS